MQHVVSDLIRGSRVYVDDDHDDEDAWLDDKDWLRLFNVEYALLYPRWVRAGVITPPFVDVELSGTTTDVNAVLAIAGVARLDGGRYTPLEHIQPRLGRSPWLNQDPGQSCGWLAYGPGDNLTVELTPPPSDLVVPVAATRGVFDVGAVINFMANMQVGTVLQMKTAGAITQTIRFIPDAVGGSPYWTQDGTLAVYHWDSSIHTTVDFEASIAADSSLTFEVITASVFNEPWADWDTIQSTTLTPVAFIGGKDRVAGNYVVRYIARPDYLTNVSQTVELPYGADERLVLGMADRAGIKSRDVSRKVMEKIQDADAQLAFLISGRGDGIRVRRTTRAPLRNDRYASPFTRDPRYWTYF